MSEKKSFRSELKELIEKHNTDEIENFDGVLLATVNEILKTFDFNMIGLFMTINNPSKQEEKGC